MMTELAKSYGAGPLSLAEIGRREHLPVAYLEQLAGPLRRAGLIEGSRGLRGGYWLVHAPGEITAGSVLRALEGEVAPVECTHPDYQFGACDREGDCLSQVLWARMKAAIDGVLDSTTLADLCQPVSGLVQPLVFTRDVANREAKMAVGPVSTCEGR